MELNPCCHHTSHILQEQQQLTWAAARESFTIASLLFNGNLCARTGSAVGTGGEEGKQAGLRISSNALQTYQLALPVSGLTPDHAEAV